MYEGEFRHDMAHGFGTYRHLDTQIVYVGEWRDDQVSLSLSLRWF